MEPYKKFREFYLSTKDILRQKENEYFVLVYWTYCPHCLAIVSDVTRYIDSNPKVKMYLLDFSGEKEAYLFKDTENTKDLSKLDFIKEYNQDSVGAKDVKDINYFYVPRLLHVKNGEVYNSVVLEDNISLYLKEYEKNI